MAFSKHIPFLTCCQLHSSGLARPWDFQATRGFDDTWAFHSRTLGQPCPLPNWPSFPILRRNISKPQRQEAGWEVCPVTLTKTCTFRPWCPDLALPAPILTVGPLPLYSGKFCGKSLARPHWALGTQLQAGVRERAQWQSCTVSLSKRVGSHVTAHMSKHCHLSCKGTQVATRILILLFTRTIQK